MLRIISLFVLLLVLSAGWQDAAFAQNTDPKQLVTENTDKTLEILKGPIAKVLGAVILLAGVAGLLRGHYKLAVSCAVAYVVLLFLNRS